MSLTKFLTLPEVKKRFAAQFPAKPLLTDEMEMRAEPIGADQKLVGRAFDYLLRFYVERLNKNAVRRSWVAEASIELMEDQLAEPQSFSKAESIVNKFIEKHRLKRKLSYGINQFSFWYLPEERKRLELRDDALSKERRQLMSLVVGDHSVVQDDRLETIEQHRIYLKKEYVKTLVKFHKPSDKIIDAIEVVRNQRFWSAHLNDARELVKIAKERLECYKSDGKLTDVLLDSTVCLAQLEAVYRSRLKYTGYSSHGSKEDLADLRKLIGIVDQDLFKSKSQCLLNPIFGKASMLVGGADADMVIDGSLIDVKVTKDPRFKRQYLDQIIGYYILSLINNENGTDLENIEIKSLGIYFARFGILHSVPVESLNVTKDFIEWFKEKAHRYISGQAV